MKLKGGCLRVWACLSAGKTRRWWSEGLRLCVLLWLGAGGFNPDGHAQGSLEFVNTGGGTPLVTRSLNFPAMNAEDQPQLVLSFGFGTDEPFQEMFVFDSFSARLQTASGSHVAVLGTADRTGVTLTPETPGGVVLAPGAIVSSPVAFPSLQPMPAFTVARSLRVDVPVEMAGQPLQLAFQLFDNLDGVHSVGAFWDTQLVIIPEPSALALIVMGSLCLLFRRQL